MGPLWTHSCFPFEHVLGKLMYNSYAKSEGIELNLAHLFKVRQQFHQVKAMMNIDPQSPYGTLMNSLGSIDATERHSQMWHEILPGIFAIGRVLEHELSEELTTAIRLSNVIPGFQERKLTVQEFTRAMVYHQRLYSLPYKANQNIKRQSWCVSYKAYNEEHIGILQHMYFIKHPQTKLLYVVGIMNRLRWEGRYPERHIEQIVSWVVSDLEEEDIDIIPLVDVTQKVIYLNHLPNKKYQGKAANFIVKFVHPNENTTIELNAQIELM